jgi:light-regulated signal transduction histidine kinase (bacteriophytochrome)
MIPNDLLHAPDSRADVIERELTEFSYIVSHDLAAPCRHLSHFSQLLLRDMGGNLTDSQRSYGSQIQAAGEKCQAMLEQLILFSRVQTCQLNCVSHDAAYLARSALLQISREVHEAEADVSIGMLGSVFGDDNLLTKVFKELILNAIRFRQPDRPCRVRVLAETADGRWVGRFIDEGIGLDPAYHEKAFRMFWRLNPEDAAGGVGAGLPIVRRIVRRHGGETRFVPCAAGACVEVELPLARSAM